MGTSALGPQLFIGGGAVLLLALLMRVYFSLDKTRVTQVREVLGENEELRRRRDELQARLDEARLRLLDATSAASIAEPHVAQLNPEIKSLRELIARLEAELKTLRG